jgi:hypothetical protein
VKGLRQNQIALLKAIGNPDGRARDRLAPGGLPDGWEEKALHKLSGRGLIETDGSVWRLTSSGEDTLVRLDLLQLRVQRRATRNWFG